MDRQLILSGFLSRLSFLYLRLSTSIMGYVVVSKKTAHRRNRYAREDSSDLYSLSAVWYNLLELWFTMVYVSQESVLDTKLSTSYQLYDGRYVDIFYRSPLY